MCETLTDCSNEPLNALLSQLKEDPCLNPAEILLNNRHLLLQIPCLEQIYLSLGFSPNRHIFKSSLDKDQVIAALSGESPYKDEVDDFREDDAFIHRPTRYELTRTYVLEGMNQLADLNEIGISSLNDTGLGNEFPDFPEDAEGQNLSMLWDQDRFSTPRTRAYMSENPTPRADRGLRLLSTKVKNIVSEHAVTTYIEVADELIQGLDEEEKKRKEEKNIKRRVYDALNVLGAAGVISKKGKQVTWVGHCPPPQACLTSCEETRQRLSNKRKRLRELSSLVYLFKGLIDRNKRRPQADSIAFPFLLVAAPYSPNNEVSVRQRGNCSMLKASFEKAYRQIEDLTVLQHLRNIKPAQMPQDLARVLSTT